MASAINSWIGRLGPGEFGLLVAALLAGAATAYYDIWRYLRRARLVEDTPTSRLRSAAQGYVELVGHGALMDGVPIVAPLSGLACLWYRYRIERRRNLLGIRGRAAWQVVRSGVSDGLFLLQDGTGSCVVDPDGAEVTPDMRRVWYGSDDSPALVLGGPRRLTFGSLARFRYTEERLLPGPLYALGWFRSVSSAESDVNEDVAALLRLWKSDKAALLARFDSNGDGELDMEEWARVREAARQQILSERAEHVADPETHTLTRPPDPRQPYLLAAGNRRTTERRYRGRTLVSLAAFVACTATLLWVIAARIS